MSTLSAAVATALDQVQRGDYDLNVSALQHVLNAIQPVLDLREAEARERYRFGWCCDFDFDHGTYRTTDCISRTRDADAVERAVRAEWAQERAALVAALEEYTRDAGFVWEAIPEWMHVAVSVEADRRARELLARITAAPLIAGEVT